MITVRALKSNDSIESITRLLNRAYAELGAMGLNFTAIDQDERTTQSRINHGVCFVAEHEGQIVGTILMLTEPGRGHPPAYFEAGTVGLTQFAVDPLMRGRGIGDALIQHLTNEAASRGFETIVLDTAQPATHLLEYYQRRGFRAVGTHQWNGKCYLSVVMCKRIVRG